MSSNPGGLPIEVRELRQVCIVVHDVEKSIERYTNIFGIGQWSIRDKDVLASFLHEREKWLRFKDNRLKQRAVEWLEDIGVELL